MNKLSFAVVGAAALALAACGGQEAENVEENVATENLEAMAADTANETEALADQANALEAENTTTEEPAGDVDAEAANVNAM